jgi:hypothetical protein
MISPLSKVTWRFADIILGFIYFAIVSQLQINVVDEARVVASNAINSIY